MSKFFTIFDTASGTVIETVCLAADVFPDPSAVVPNADGEDVAAYGAWNAATMSFVEVVAGIDPAASEFDGAAWVSSARLERERRWDEAKAYREIRRTASLAVYGVFPDRAVTVKMDVESRLTISGAVTTATIFKASGLPFSFTFDDESGTDTTVDADQTIALGLGVAVYSGLCDARLRAIRLDLDAAVAAGASAEEITAIDITAGYPALGEAGA